MVRAAIDVGSNSLLLTVMDDTRVLHDEARIVGLGTGLGDGGRMQASRRQHGFEVLRSYVGIAATLGVEAQDIRAAATSGARRATDAPVFFSRVREELGLDVRTIAGDEEARLSWRGALHGLQLRWPVLLIDLGGGSTELVTGSHEETMTWRSSREYGAVRLQEAHADDLEAMGAQVDQDLKGLPLHAEQVVAVAGTATMFGAMELGLKRWDGAAIHGLSISRHQLQTWMQRFSQATPEQRRRMAHLAPERGPYLAGGALVLDRVLAAARAEGLVLSNGGLRFGLLAS